MSAPQWHSRGNRAARDLEAAIGAGKRRRGGHRPGAGRKRRFFLRKALGAWNRHAIVDAMLHAMSVNPFGREPFAQVPGDPRPSSTIAAMLVALMLRDRVAHARMTEEIVAGGYRKRAALLRLRRAGGASARRTGPGSTPSWRTCMTYYKQHRAAGGVPDYNDDGRLALHRAGS